VRAASIILRNGRGFGARCAANFETLPVWPFQRTPTTFRAHDDIGASAPEQREQDDDRKGNSEYPQQQAATEAHHVLL
jgi:hypothetical protein